MKKLFFVIAVTTVVLFISGCKNCDDKKFSGYAPAVITDIYQLSCGRIVVDVSFNELKYYAYYDDGYDSYLNYLEAEKKKNKGGLKVSTTITHESCEVVEIHTYERNGKIVTL